MIALIVIGVVIGVILYLIIGVYCATRFSWCFGVSHNGYHTPGTLILKHTIFPLIVLFWPFFGIWLIFALFFD